MASEFFEDLYDFISYSDLLIRLKRMMMFVTFQNCHFLFQVLPTVGTEQTRRARRTGAGHRIFYTI